LGKLDRLVILDRDGVINEDSDDYIKSLNEWQPIPGSLKAITRLNQAGYCVIVITNQSGIARGYYSWSILAAIHDKMQNALAKVGGKIAKIYICPHHPDDNCNCRKPKTGLLKQAAKDFNIADWSKVILVGDKLCDLELAQAIGCKPVLVLTGKGKRLAVEKLDSEIMVKKDLAAVVDWMLEEKK
jgi:D-glycero-D-manno-heptose 1,7-bisphosphate phosphatase